MDRLCKIKTIGVLTSGGDSPGMNAAVYAVTQAALGRGMRVMGIRRGYAGLIGGDIFELDSLAVSGIIHKGGTFLNTARCPEFKSEDGIRRAVEVCRQFGIDGVVVVGGDGSLRGAADLSARGVPCVGLPGTIDNDIAASDYSIGYDTALNTVMRMVDKLRDTSMSHDRCSVVEVMGRKTGWLTLEAGFAVGATYIILPEFEYDFEDLVARMNKFLEEGKKHFIVMVAEGVGGVVELAQRIEARTGVESRATILGHVQRGGSPCARDRVAASRLGYHAVSLLSRGVGDRVVVLQKDEVRDYDIREALGMTKKMDRFMYDMASVLSC